MTYTLAELELSAAAYDEIRGKLEAAGYSHAIGDGDRGILDMTHIGVTSEPVGPGGHVRADALVKPTFDAAHALMRGREAGLVADQGEESS